ncbi:hypothetical protein [Mariniblastus fucicola]|uniref:Transmembrane protein n=1 Tax=Mariniblastus fucicola TaxID=980251 RepID=A0A5B9PAP0_9BACT|nr:hypothetical protein [Mariniblastus fucicola]QEG23438.1 hypothetical protein MFFC18_33370 [Mariniblastus fucicola]
MTINESELSDEGKAILDASRDPIGKSWALGILGAFLGAAAGWFIFRWAFSQGYYVLALPGAAVGLGFSALASRRMFAGGIFCAVVAFFVTVGCEWNERPFNDDNSFTYFLTHLHKVDDQMTIVMLVIGVLLAFWFGRGR